MKTLLLFLALVVRGFEPACGSQCKQIVFVNDTAQGFRKEAPQPLKVEEFTPSLWLYPNPSQGWVQASVHLPEATQTAELRLYNSLGNEAGRYPIPKPRSVLELNANHLPSGLYHCVLIADGNNITSVKLIIE